MWLLVMTLVAAAVIVLVTGGKPRELAHMHLTGVWMLFVGLGLQIVLEFVDIPKSQYDTVGYAILMASYVFILGFCLANVSIRGFGVIAVGVAMNTLVIGLNQGMPTAAIGNDAKGNRIEKPIEQSVKHRPETDDDLLSILDDQIVLPKPFDEVLSFGDLVIAVGICELAYFGTRRRRRRGTAAFTQSRATSTPRRSNTRSSAPTTRPS